MHRHDELRQHRHQSSLYRGVRIGGDLCGHNSGALHFLVQLGRKELFCALASPVVVPGGKQRHHRRATGRHHFCYRRWLYPVGYRARLLVGFTQERLGGQHPVDARGRPARQSLCLQCRALQSQRSELRPTGAPRRAFLSIGAQGITYPTDAFSGTSEWSTFTMARRTRNEMPILTSP